MLLQLNIREYGIIENLCIEFKEGLTVLSGETGAGKSMILSAISQLTGQKTSTIYIRHGKEKATIEGVFDYIHDENLIKILEDLDISTKEEILVIKRDIYKSGKSICRINNVIVNLSVLKKISSFFIDIHEQRDGNILLSEKNHLLLLDQFGMNDLQPYIENYNNNYLEYKVLKEKLINIENENRELTEKIDFIRYQIQELELLNLKEGEIVTLEEKIDYLSNYEKINFICNNIKNNIVKENGILEQTYDIKILIEKLAKYTNKLNDKIEKINDYYYLIEDVNNDIDDLINNIDFDEEILDTMESRLFELKSIEKKYSKSIDELISYKKELNEKLYNFENFDNNLSQIKKKVNTKELELRKSADNLSEKRKEIAVKMEELIEKELKYLYMENSTIKIDFQKKEFSQNGVDEVKFLISANEGEPLKSLSKVASGGELSRIMLGLKIIYTNKNSSLLTIFDEIDTGVSGRVAQRMAEKIYQLSISSQVFAITHLPQMVAIADNNLLIKKKEINGRTISDVYELDDNKKVIEIAKMISTSSITEITKKHSLEMINNAKKIKKGLNKIYDK